MPRCLWGGAPHTIRLVKPAAAFERYIGHLPDTFHPLDIKPPRHLACGKSAAARTRQPPRAQPGERKPQQWFLSIILIIRKITNFFGNSGIIYNLIDFRRLESISNELATYLFLLLAVSYHPCCPSLTKIPQDVSQEMIPNISPMPVMTMKTGATIFTAAMPSGPAPRPTNIPSMTVNTELKIIPTSVGKNSDRNIGPIASRKIESVSIQISVFLHRC